MTNIECAGIAISSSLLSAIIGCAFGHLVFGPIDAHKEAIKHHAAFYVSAKDGSADFKWRDELTDVQKQLMDATVKDLK